MHGLKPARISPVWRYMFENGILSEHQPLHYKLQFEGDNKEYTGKALAVKDGLVVDGEISTPSSCLLKSLFDQSVSLVGSPSINGWFVWRDEQGLTLSELATRLPEIKVKLPSRISHVLKEYQFKVEKDDNYLTFFGAGASRGAAIPTQDQLMKFVLFSKDKRVTNTVTYIKFKEFFDKFFFVDLKSGWFPSVEHVFGFLDYFIYNNKSLGGKYNAYYLSVIKAYFVRLIQFEIKLKVDHRLDSFDLSGDYFNFLQNMLCLGQQSTIVTLNYDILLSSSFTNLFPFNVYLDYGMDLVNYRSLDYVDLSYNWINPENSIFSPVNFPPRRVRVLKLHGSTNWKYCDSCESVFVSSWDDLLNVDLRVMNSDEEYVKEMVNNKEMYCESCAGRLRALIMPPSHLKDFSQPIAARLYKRFLDHLKRVNKVLFIGYSFSEADVHIKALLNSRPHLFQQVHVINPSMTEASKGIYKSITDNFYHHELRFGEWVGDIDCFKKVTQ